MKRTKKIEKLPDGSTLLGLLDMWIARNPQWSVSFKRISMPVWHSMIASLGNSSMTLERAEAFKNTLLEKYQPSTVATALTSCRMFGKWLFQNDYISKNPWEQIKTPAFNYRRARADRVTDEEYQIAKKSLMTWRWNYYFLLVVQYRTGMRISDACLLTEDQIDWKNMVIRYLPLKTRRKGREAVCPIVIDPTSPGYDLLTVLQEALDKREEHWSGIKFVNPQLADDYTSDRAKMKLRRYLHRAGLNRSSHSLRRGCISALANHSNMNPMVACQITGQHISTFMSYVTPDTNAMREQLTIAYKNNDSTCKQHLQSLPVKSQSNPAPESPADPVKP